MGLCLDYVKLGGDFKVFLFGNIEIRQIAGNLLGFETFNQEVGLPMCTCNQEMGLE